MLPTHFGCYDARLDVVDREVRMFEVQVLEETGSSGFGGCIGGDIGNGWQLYDRYVRRAEQQRLATEQLMRQNAMLAREKDKAAALQQHSRNTALAIQLKIREDLHERYQRIH